MKTRPGISRECVRSLPLALTLGVLLWALIAYAAVAAVRAAL